MRALAILPLILSSLAFAQTSWPHRLPDLPYAYEALEPHIDKATMEIHHRRHHQAYVDGLNRALIGTPYETWLLEDLLRSFDSLPNELKPAVRNHGGGHANHSLFWTILSPAPKAAEQGPFLEAVNQQFGSLEALRQALTQAALSVFGSGWAWLSVDGQGKLLVETTPNQDSPLMLGHTPILGIDVWEHAYYLKHQNRRADYLEAFWKVLDWSAVAERYQQALTRQKG
ncbi:MAG: superoxide dismutase [Mn] [Lysobacterales bacterium]|jgi:Fe-Mn family superoxide dismutase|nr:MAG: superoxide dismutase [Mn] [Xanthomonadales bacterium]